MDVILVRHADAEEANIRNNFLDEARELTELGRRQAEALAKFFEKMGIIPGHVVTSSFSRAAQTAEPLVHLMAAHDFVECEYLVSGTYKPRKLAEFLAAFERSPIVLVGHMPEIGQYAAWMIDADEPFSFVKGQAMCIRFDEASEKGEGKLAWTVTPTGYM
jgi:phosphohistidine phosphatase